MYCHNCDYEFVGVDDFDSLFITVECPVCGSKYSIEYDEIWTGEDEYQYFYLEQIK